MLKTQVSGHCSNICQHWKTIEHGWSLNFFSQPKPHSQMGTGTVVVLNTVSLISSGTLWKHLLYLCVSAQLCWWQLQYWLQHRMVRVLGLSERQILYAKSCRHLPTLENKWACWSWNFFSQPKPHSQMGTGTVVVLNTVSLISSGTLWKHLLYLCISAQLCWWQLQYWLQHWLRCWLQYWLQHRMVRVLGLSERQILYAKSCRHLPTLENKWACWSWNFFSQPKPHSQRGAVVILNIVALISSGTLWKHLLYLCISAQLCCWWQLQYWLQHRMVRVLGLSERQILYAKSCRHFPTLENNWACWSLNFFSQPKPHSQMGTGTVVLNTVSLISSGTLWKHLLYLYVSLYLCAVVLVAAAILVATPEGAGSWTKWTPDTLCKILPTFANIGKQVSMLIIEFLQST